MRVGVVAFDSQESGKCENRMERVESCAVVVVQPVTFSCKANVRTPIHPLALVYRPNELHRGYIHPLRPSPA